MARNTKKRKLVWVKVSKSLATVKYGFNSGADGGDRATLGQTDVGTDITGLIIGANNIKPGKASKVKSTGTESSFYSYDKATDLKAAGWILGRPKARNYRKTTKSTLYYVTINGVKYGWRSANSVEAVDVTSLGLKEPTAKDLDVIYGCSFPKPPRAAQVLKSGSIYSTFVDPGKADSLAEPWFLSGSGNTALLA